MLARELACMLLWLAIEAIRIKVASLASTVRLKLTAYNIDIRS